MQECGIYIVDMSCGSATVAVKVDPKRHANLNGMAHGGLVATLADNATGIAGATIGKRVVTINYCYRFYQRRTGGYDDQRYFTDNTR